jgi:hypothetical protein
VRPEPDDVGGGAPRPPLDVVGGGAPRPPLDVVRGGGLVGGAERGRGATRDVEPDDRDVAAPPRLLVAGGLLTLPLVEPPRRTPGDTVRLGGRLVTAGGAERAGAREAELADGGEPPPPRERLVAVLGRVDVAPRVAGARVAGALVDGMAARFEPPLVDGMAARFEPPADDTPRLVVVRPVVVPGDARLVVAARFGGAVAIPRLAVVRPVEVVPTVGRLVVAARPDALPADTLRLVVVRPVVVVAGRLVVALRLDTAPADTPRDVAVRPGTVARAVVLPVRDAAEPTAGWPDRVVALRWPTVVAGRPLAVAAPPAVVRGLTMPGALPSRRTAVRALGDRSGAACAVTTAGRTGATCRSVKFDHAPGTPPRRGTA